MAKTLKDYTTEALEKELSIRKAKERLKPGSFVKEKKGYKKVGIVRGHRLMGKNKNFWYIVTWYPWAESSGQRHTASPGDIIEITKREYDDTTNAFYAWYSHVRWKGCHNAAWKFWAQPNNYC